MNETIPSALAGQRLDRVVAMLADVSRGVAAGMVDAGEVTVDGTVITTRSHRINAGEEIAFALPEVVSEGPAPDRSVPVPVVHEDAHLLVVDKPAGLVVHPGAGHAEGTLVSGLLARYPSIAGVGEPDRPGIVHRLDKGTSGLLLVALSDEAYTGLVERLAARMVERRYRALVWGKVEAPAGMVDAPVGRSARDRTRMSVTARGRPAVTYYQVCHRFADPAEATELELVLATGRTHQIRVHMASIGHPVVGDDRYGGRRPSLLAPGRCWLHAEHLELDHPVTGESLSFTSSLPADLLGARDQLT